MEKIRRIVTILGSMLLLLSMAFLWSNRNLEARAGAEICTGVHIGEVDVSGMTTEQAKAAVEQYINKMKQTEITLITAQQQEVIATIGDFQPIWLNPEVAEQACTVATEGNVVSRYKAIKDIEQNGLQLELQIGFDEEAVVNYLEENCTVYDQELVNATIIRENGTFIIQEGEPGQVLDVYSSALLLQNNLYQDYLVGVREMELVIQELYPEGSLEDFAMVKDLLGSCTTSFSSSNANRSANVTNGCRLINGKVLYPGEEFSAYEAVRPFTEENGFYMAGSYMNGQVVDSLGGGICQVSTTLYNAVLMAELEVTQRYPHSMVVSYAAKSADAAIAESSGKDFRFVNNTEYPIYIEGYTENKQITFNIYGAETRDSSRRVEYVSEVLSENVPETESIIPSATEGVGYVSVTSAHIGYRARLWKVVYENGVEVSREVVNNSTYAASPRTAVVGVHTADPNRYNQIMAAIATGSIDQCKAVAAQLLVEEQNSAAAASGQGIVVVPEL